MPVASDPARAGWAGLASRIITIWALLGGALLVAVVAINTLSVLGGIFWKPFPGDFELTEMGVAVAVFSFLPYCQLVDANVTADIFTQKASAKTLARIKLATAIIALSFAGLLLWRMFAGMLNQKDYGYTTAILQLPVWMAYVPILLSLALLALAALVSLSDQTRALRERA